MNIRRGNELIERLYSSCCDEGELFTFHSVTINKPKNDRDGIRCPFCGKEFKITYNKKISKILKFTER